jgi:hypothetical protein
MTRFYPYPFFSDNCFIEDGSVTCTAIATKWLYSFTFGFIILELYSYNITYIPHILESNPHLVFATFLNEKKLVRASNPHLSFNRPLPTGRLFE